MKIKNVKLEWYALRYDSNEKKILWFNVLRNDMKEEIAKLVRANKIYNLESLAAYINREFMYYYWSKCEYEIVVGSLFADEWEKAEKIDVYSQLKPNIYRIAEYINRAMELKLH